MFTKIIRGKMILDIDGERIDANSIEKIYKYFPEKGDALEK